MSQIRTVFKNMGWVTLSQIVTNVCAFLWTILIARYLGVSDYGILSFVISFTVLIGIGNDIGMTTFATRELSRDRNNTKKFVNNILPFKLFLSTLFLIFTVLVVYLLGYNNLVIEVTFLMYLETIVLGLFNFLCAVYQAHENLKPSSISLIIYSVSLLVFTVIISVLDLGLVCVALSYLLAYLLCFIYGFYYFVKIYGMPHFEFDFSFWKNTLFSSVPFALTTFFFTIYFSIDVVMISWLSGDYSTGIYNSAYKLISVFTAFYVVYQSVIFPLMSKLYAEDTNLLKISFETSFKYSLLVLLPICIGVYLYAPYIITLIYSNQYALASAPMQILIWTVLFLFMNYVTTSLLNSIGKEISVTKIYIVAAIFNIVLNYILIPSYSYIGASISTVLSEILILALMIFSISKTEYMPDFSLVIKLIKLLISGLVLFVVLEYIHVSLWLAIPIGLVVYILALLLTRSIDDTDRYIVKELLNR